jgi:pyruvate dehydrogenase E1 component
MLSATIPNCVSYDPTFAYEVAVIVQNGLKRMVEDQEDVFYYLTVMNENYEHPAMPEGAQDGIIKGMYLLKAVDANAKGHKVQLMGSGTILREVLAGAELLEKDFGIHADVWSVTSYTELAREAAAIERWNLLNPEETPRVAYVTEMLAARGDGPVISSTDYIRAYSEQIRPYVPAKYRTLGTDGFGRSDFRRKLRSHFEVDRHFVAISALKALADENKVPSAKVAEAIRKYGIDPGKPDPTTA